MFELMIKRKNRKLQVGVNKGKRKPA